MHRHILALYMYYVNARLFPARCNDEDDESTMFMHVRAYMYIVCSYFIAVPYTCACIHVHVIVVSWFLQCMGYVPHEGCTIPCTVKTMRQLSCTDMLYKATARLASAPEYSTYCTLTA